MWLTTSGTIEHTLAERPLETASDDIRVNFGLKRVWHRFGDSSPLADYFEYLHPLPKQLPKTLSLVGTNRITKSVPDPYGLWLVSDISSMFLMERFYSNHFSGVLQPVALREAQLWLRRVSAGEVASRFSTERRTSDHTGTIFYELASAVWRRLVNLKTSMCPFDNPFLLGSIRFHRYLMSRN